MKQKTLSRNRLFAFCALGALATSIQTHAAAVVTEHGPFGEVGGLTNSQVIALHPVGIGDVLESATRSIVSGRVKTEWGSTEDLINDGLAIDAAGNSHYSENGTQLEFQLGSPIDVAQIDFATYADWKRTSIWVDVETSTDGGTNWSLLHEVRVAEPNDPHTSDRQYNAASLTDTTGTLASNVNALRFTFLGDGMGDQESGYAEIDVYADVDWRFPWTIERSGSDLLLRWDSKAGRLYNLRSETDPSNGEPATWPIFGGHEDMEATPPENTLTIPLPPDPTRFFVIEAFPAPPIVLYSTDFEGGAVGWTTLVNDENANTAWELGSPAGSTGPVAGATESANAWSTNLGDYGPDSDISLRSPAIDLSGIAEAELSFEAYRDADGFGDAAVVRFLRASDLEQLGGEVPIDMEVFDVDWKMIRLPVPPQAIGETVLIEWNFISDNTPDTYSGLSIDDVRVGD